MKAIVIEGFDGRADNATEVRTFKPGDVVEGSLAEVAVDEGWADPIDEDDGEQDVPPPRQPNRKSGKKSTPQTDGQ